MTREEKIARFAALLEQEQKDRYARDCPNLDSVAVRVRPGAKYVKVDVGTSGKYMIDGEDIFGIKAYGVIHRGHHYGTLDTIDNYNWGGYVAIKK